MSTTRTLAGTAAIFVLSMVLFANVAWAQTSVRGHVLASLAKGENIEVRLLTQDGIVEMRSYTNSDGDFQFQAVKSGVHYVEATVVGYETARERLDITAGSAVVNLSLVRKADPNDPDTIDRSKYSKKALDEFDKSVDEIRKGNGEKTIPRLEGVLKAEPSFVPAYISLGTLYQNAKRYDDAERTYRKAAELNPRSAQPLVNLGSLYMAKAEAGAAQGPAVVGPIVTAAHDALTQAIQLNPRNPTAYLMMGTLAYKAGYLDEAEANLKQALDIDSHLNQAHLALVNVYNRQQKLSSVLEQLDAFLKDNPKGPEHDQMQKVRDSVVEKVKAGQ